MAMLEKRFVPVNGVNLHVVSAGPEKGEPILFLHGFPEFWYGWHHQIHYLAEKGYRVIAPDQRGYNLSDKPSGVHNYTIPTISKDASELIKSLGYEQVNLVGHDWGATIAWDVAHSYPEQIRRLIILNNGHGLGYRRAINKNRKQLRKSWYMLYFQIPWLPEATTRANNFRALLRSTGMVADGSSFTPEDIEMYLEAWSQPDALTHMIHWYRAIFRGDSSYLREIHNAGGMKITMPTLAMWGTQDAYLEVDVIHESIKDCDEVELILFEDAGHWVQYDKADEVNAHIDRFVSGG